VINYIKGNFGLFKTYWLINVPLSLIFKGVNFYISRNIEFENGSPTAIFFACAIVIFILCVTVSTWNSAEKYLGLKIWILLAKAQCILITLPFLIAVCFYFYDQTVKLMSDTSSRTEYEEKASTNEGKRIDGNQIISIGSKKKDGSEDFYYIDLRSIRKQVDDSFVYDLYTEYDPKIDLQIEEKSITYNDVASVKVRFQIFCSTKTEKRLSVEIYNAKVFSTTKKRLDDGKLPKNALDEIHPLSNSKVDDAIYKLVCKPSISEKTTFENYYFELSKEFKTTLKDSDKTLILKIATVMRNDSHHRVLGGLKKHESIIDFAILEIMNQTTDLDIAQPEFRSGLAHKILTRINSTLVNYEGFDGIDDVFFTTFILQ